MLAPHPSFGEVIAQVLGENGHAVEVSEVDMAFETVAPLFLDFAEKIGSTTWSTSPQVSRKFWGLVYAAEFERLGIEDPDGRLANLLYDRFTRFDTYRLFPDVIPALEQMKDQGMLLGVISNFEEWLEGLLSEWEVAHLFEVLVISGREGIEKPDPDIFRRALERTGLDPEESIYVGDHPQLDVEASESVGMKGVLIDRRGRHPGFSGIRITSLDQLLPAVQATADR